MYMYIKNDLVFTEKNLHSLEIKHVQIIIQHNG